MKSLSSHILTSFCDITIYLLQLAAFIIILILALGLGGVVLLWPISLIAWTTGHVSAINVIVEIVYAIFVMGVFQGIVNYINSNRIEDTDEDQNFTHQ